MAKIAELESPDEKSRICLAVLRALPEWFGVESAIQGFTVSVKSLPFFTARNRDRDVGFLTLKRNTPSAMEIHVMGVLKEWQRRGIGTSLLAQAELYALKEGAEFLTVKAVDESSPDGFYAKTRRFYLGAGFKPLEIFPLHWNTENPCLFMVKPLRENTRFDWDTVKSPKEVKPIIVEVPDFPSKTRTVWCKEE